jgi:two-component system OmpR family response regulator
MALARRLVAVIVLGMSDDYRILVVDDDPEIRDLTAGFLIRHGLSAEGAGDGTAMWEKLSEKRFDLVVLDLMLPGDDGLTLCRKLRQRTEIPIVMLTALGEEADRIVGLEMGADDYLAKPFNPRELLARIRAVLRRSGDSASNINGANNPSGPGGRNRRLCFGGWEIDLSRRELHDPDGVLTGLTAGEYDLLLALAERPNRVLSRDELMDITRGRIASAFDRSIDVQLSRLRRKIEADPKNPEIIKTVRTGGYVFAQDVRYGKAGQGC